MGRVVGSLACVLALAVSSSSHARSSGLGTCTAGAPSTLTENGLSAFAVSVASKADIAYFEALARKECVIAIVHHIEALGDRVLYTDARVGYIAARVPTSHALALAEERGIVVSSVQHMDSNAPQATAPLPNPVVEQVAPSFGTLSPPPYFPAREAGLLPLRAIGGDGRGIRIGLVDEGVDIFHPGLQLAKDARGRIIPKIVKTVHDLAGVGDQTWIAPEAWGTAIGHRIRAFGRDWVTPYDGQFALAHFRQVVQGVASSSQLSGVALIDFDNREAWLDPTASGNFTKTPPAHDYRSRRDLAFWGQVSKSRDDRIPYTVVFDKATRAIELNIAGAHGTFVAGTMAANRWTGGLFDGAAPAAQIIDIPDLARPLTDVLVAFARPDVDLVNRSGSLGYALAHPNLDPDVARPVVQKAIEVYGKPIFCFCDIADAIDVWDYQSEQELRVNRRLQDLHGEFLTPAAFPEADGLSNVLHVPSVSLTTTYRVHNGTEKLSEPPAPSGYAIGDNPSPTISLASGIGAVLLQLARARHIPLDVFRLQQALLLSSQPIAGYYTWQQGAGKVRADRAWRLIGRVAELETRRHIATRFTVVDGKTGLRTDGGLYLAPRPNVSISGTLRLAPSQLATHLNSYKLDTIGDPGFRVWPKHIDLGQDENALVHYRTPSFGGRALAFLVIRDARTGTPLQSFPLQYVGFDEPTTSEPGIETYRFVVPPRKGRQIVARLSPTAQLTSVSVDVPGAGPFIYGFPQTLMMWKAMASLRRLYGSGKAPTEYERAVAKNAGRDPSEFSSSGSATIRHYFAEFRSPKTDRIGILLDNRALPEYDVRGLPKPVPEKTRITVRTFSTNVRLNQENVWITNTGSAGVMRLVALNAVAAPLRFSSRNGGMAVASIEIPKAAAQLNLSIQPQRAARRFTVTLVRCDDAPSGTCTSLIVGSRQRSLVLHDVERGRYVIVVIPEDSMLRAIAGTAVVIGSKQTPLENWRPRRNGEKWAIVNRRKDESSYVALQVFDSPLNPDPPFLDAIRLR
jgi:hypothetical protein